MMDLVVRNTSNLRYFISLLNDTFSSQRCSSSVSRSRRVVATEHLVSWRGHWRIERSLTLTLLTASASSSSILCQEVRWPLSPFFLASVCNFFCVIDLIGRDSCVFAQVKKEKTSVRSFSGRCWVRRSTGGGGAGEVVFLAHGISLFRVWRMLDFGRTSVIACRWSS